MKYLVYILLCDEKTFYIGSTDNIERRLAEHQAKKSFYTKQFSRLGLVYQEAHNSRRKAENREKQIKGWSVAKKRALIVGDMTKLKVLSKGH